MSEEENPKKRVGSWREYLAYVAEKWTLASIGFVLLIIGLLGTIFIFDYFCQNSSLPFVAALLCFVIMAFCLGILWASYKTLKVANTMPPIVPPSRQNTASLPAQDVLVRASAEPTEEAGKTLLRGAVKDGETPAEELLRPTSTGD